LLCAATTGSEETVHLLLAKGANPLAQDWRGRTALDWAQKRGSTGIVGLLRRASKQADPQAKVVAQGPRRLPELPLLIQKLDGDSAHKAVAASLPLLQQSGRKISETKGCITCHQHSLVAMTVGLTRKRGFAVDEETASREREQLSAVLGKKVPTILLGADLDPTLSAYTLVGLAAEDQLPTPLTDALVQYLVLHQHPDGHWQPEAYRPPDEGSPFLFTALAARGLQVYSSPGRRNEISVRIARARQWLASATPAEAVDLAYQLLGLGWTQASVKDIDKAVATVLSQQREDGGWAQLPLLPSDAYATGQMLVALHEAGGLPATAPAYRRGVEFLLRSQLADGSWFVPTRCFPALEFSQSGFPHGRSQFISAAGTCWATMALALTVPSSP
jgi:hypothetical protein